MRSCAHEQKESPPPRFWDNGEDDENDFLRKKIETERGRYDIFSTVPPTKTAVVLLLIEGEHTHRHRQLARRMSSFFNARDDATLASGFREVERRDSCSGLFFRPVVVALVAIKISLFTPFSVGAELKLRL